METPMTTDTNAIGSNRHVDSLANEPTKSGGTMPLREVSHSGGSAESIDKADALLHDVEAGTIPAGMYGTLPEEAGPQLSRPMLSRPKMVLIALAMMMTYFLGTFSSSRMTLMVPEIAKSLNTTELAAQWVVSAYLLAFACGLLFAGRFSDLFGRKLLYLTGLSTFCLFSFLSAVVKHRIGLCILRAICGLGLAIASPAEFGIVGVCFRTEPARTIAFAAYGLGAPLGSACGTPIAGVIAARNSDGWTNLFYLLGGLAIIPILIGILAIPKNERMNIHQEGVLDRRVDWIGGIIVTLGLCLFCFSLTESGIAEKRWSAPYVPALFGTSIILLVAFALWERHLEQSTSLPPIVKLSDFTRHQYKISLVVLSTFFVVMSCYGYVYLASIWYQSYKGLSALQSALRTLPCMISGVVAAISIMWLGPRVRAPWLIHVGATMTGVASLMFAVEPEGTSYWSLEFVSFILMPWGIDFMVCLGNVMVSNLVEENEQSVGGAVFQTAIQVGASLGTCLASLVSTARAEVTNDILRGLRDAYWMMAACAWIVPVIVFFGLRRVRLAKDVGQTTMSTQIRVWTLIRYVSHIISISRSSSIHRCISQWRSPEYRRTDMYIPRPHLKSPLYDSGRVSSA